MAEYVVSDAKLQELNVLINKAGGENTSEINRKHAEVVGVANTLPASVGQQRSKIIKLTESAEGNNRTVGETLGAMQQWHDDVKASGGGEEPGPGPGPSPGAIPVSPTRGADGLMYLPDLLPGTGGVNYTFVASLGERYTFKLARDGFNVSYSCPSGPCHCGAGSSPGGTEIAGQPGNDNAIILGPLAAGKWFTFWLGDGHSPQGTCIYSG